MRFQRTLVFLSFLPWAACSSSAPPSTSTPPNPPSPQAPPATEASLASIVTGPGDYQLTFAERPFILHVPPAYDGSKLLPLVFILHGYGGAAGGMVNMTGMNDPANQAGFLVAYLNATGETPEWNASNTALATNHVPADDSGYVRALIAKLTKDLKVNSERIYAAGLSNGGGMSYRLGAELSDLLAAVAAVAGAVGHTDADGVAHSIPTPSGPIPVLIIHGMEDPNIPYEGGVGTGGASEQFQFSARSVADAVKLWTAANACTGSPIHHVSDNGNIIVDDYATCANGSQVKLISIVNGKHQWPTPDDQTHFPASQAIWKFFSAHPK